MLCQVYSVAIYLITAGVFLSQFIEI